jgi:hypothetical protein
MCHHRRTANIGECLVTAEPSRFSTSYDCAEKLRLVGHEH